METFTDIFKALWGVWKEMVKDFFFYLPKALYFVLWVICGMLILPCVFVAGNFYPAWTKWGEKF